METIRFVYKYLRAIKADSNNMFIEDIIAYHKGITVA